MLQLKLVSSRTEQPEPTEKGSARIRVARSIICELLMLDEEDSVLVGCVSGPLNEIAVELDRLAGVQTLYELWVG